LRSLHHSRQHGLHLQDDLQVVAGAELQQAWRWELRPEGQREQLVVFRHGRADEQGQLEVRAAVLESAHGRGLVYASRAAGGQAIGYYDGTIVTPAEYSELNEDTGLRHTLRVGRAWVNGINP